MKRTLGNLAPKFAASFLAAVVGWFSGFLVYASYMTFFTPWRRPTDSDAILFWTAIFIALSWLLIVLPLALILDEPNRIPPFPYSVLIGGIAGVVIFAGLVGWWTGFWQDPLFLTYAAVVGASTGGVYSPLATLLRSRSGRSA